MYAKRLKCERLMQGITQRDLAECAGLAHGVVGHIESRDGEMTLTTAIKICRALEVSLDSFAKPVTNAEWVAAVEKNREIRRKKAIIRAKKKRQYRAYYSERIKNSRC